MHRKLLGQLAAIGKSIWLGLVSVLGLALDEED